MNIKKVLGKCLMLLAPIPIVIQWLLMTGMVIGHTVIWEGRYGALTWADTTRIALPEYVFLIFVFPAGLILWYIGRAEAKNTRGSFLRKTRRK
jgi:hypothetical protein